jgi:iron complex transport system permease protein
MKSYLTKRRAGLALALLAGALLVAIVLSLAFGSEPLGLRSVATGLTARLFGATSPLTVEHEAILFYRLPRVLLAVGVGAALALAGAAFQALLRNPLADPYLLGISSGAALGAITGLIAASYFPANSALLRAACSFLGALLASLLVYQLGKREDDPARLALAGVIVSTSLSSLNVLLLALVDEMSLRNITLWMLGDLSSGTPEGLAFVCAAVLIGLALLLGQARALNLMMIGERDAFALGVETTRVLWLVFLTAALLTGAAVSTGGSIGFIGLLTPHLIRLAAGADNRLVLPASALAGALLTLAADTTARTLLAPRELPAGAITALLGAPVFIYLLGKNR